jgi:hypothetical protein
MSNGNMAGSHGVPLSSTPSQAAGNVKLILRPKGELSLGFSIAPGGWCEFTATLSPLK